MSRKVTGFPAWATRFLRRLGYRPGNVMDEHVRAWWGWYQVDNGFYGVDRPDTGRGDCPDRHLSLRPARMASDEWASLVMDDKTQMGSEDAAVNAWVEERMGGFVGDELEHLALSFALGTGAWVADFDGIVGDSTSMATASISFYDASQICPLETDGDESVSCAFVRRIEHGRETLDQLQVHEPDPGTGTYHVRTWLFGARSHKAPLVADDIIADLDTGTTIPCYALVRPAIANTYEEWTPLGVSVFDDAQDAIKLVDEAFDASYWRLRVCQPRMVVDETGLRRDPKTGDLDLVGTVDKRVFKAISGGGDHPQPATVYDPGLQAQETDTALNSALSMFSAKCGFGPNYFSYSRQSGLRTATEVSADNSQLFRNVRRHEQVVGAAIERLVAGAYAAETALRTGTDPGTPDVTVTWDDSIVEDTATERNLMKDDISRGLCPAYLYPMRYYGMDEDAARALVGAQQAVPEEV